jgi:hypothetical protein
MRNILKVTLLAAMAFALVGALGYFSPAQRPELPNDAKFALQHFLDVDCEQKEEQGEALNRMLTFKAVLEPHLIATLREGPDKQNLDETQRSLEEQWNLREAYLRKNPDLGLKENELQIAKGLTKDAFISQGRERVIRKYREKSAIGLAAIGSPEAIKTLREVNEKGDEALRTVIQAALEKYQKK